MCALPAASHPGNSFKLNFHHSSQQGELLLLTVNVEKGVWEREHVLDAWRGLLLAISLENSTSASTVDENSGFGSVTQNWEYLGLWWEIIHAGNHCSGNSLCVLMASRSVNNSGTTKYFSARGELCGRGTWTTSSGCVHHESPRWKWLVC